MEGALIVSCVEKNIVFFTEMLNANAINNITTVSSCSEARYILLERDFDLVIVDSPLSDESGEVLSRHIAVKNTQQVILLVASEYFDAVSQICEKDGVLTIAKPLSREFVWVALKIAEAAHNRFLRMKSEDGSLREKIETIRIVDKAKYALITHRGMSEGDAHRFIEKTAMDMRTTKRVVAEGIIWNYED